MAWRMKHRGQRALLDQGWKYLQIDGIDYLFDLRTDARERANLARRHPETLARLRTQWEAWNAQLPPIPEEAQSRLPYSRQDIP
jgi:arylsulfatase A-like enzyme